MSINRPIAIVILLLVAFVMTFLLVIPQYQETTTLQSALDRKQADYTNKQSYYADLLDVLKTIKNQKDLLVKIDDALPNNVAFAPLIYFFQADAASSNLTVNTIAFSQDQQPVETPSSSAAPSQPALQQVIITLSMAGNYQGLKHFLSALETSDRLLNVESIAFDTV